MTQPRTTTNVHLEFVDEPIEAELRYLNREQFDDTIIVHLGPVAFFMSPQQARQIVTAIAADLEAITTEETR
jgi:hypothetical protein